MCSSLSIAAAPTLLKLLSMHRHQLKSIDIANIKHPGKPGSAFYNEPTTMKSHFWNCSSCSLLLSTTEGCPQATWACLSLNVTLLYLSCMEVAHTWSNLRFNSLLGVFYLFFKTICCRLQKPKCFWIPICAFMHQNTFKKLILNKSISRRALLLICTGIVAVRH